MKPKIYIINGANLNMLAKRESSIYGGQNLQEYEVKLTEMYPSVDLIFLYSNHEGEIVDNIQKVPKDSWGIVINPGAYTHTSIAIADALRSKTVPIVEVHISQVFSREPYRRRSYIAEVSEASISGMGLNGYDYAIDFLAKKNPSSKD